MVTAVPLHSQLPVSPGDTHVPGSAQTQKGVYPGAKPFLRDKWGTRYPFQGLCLCRWEANLETGAKTHKSTSTCFGSLLQAPAAFAAGPRRQPI